MDMKDKKKAANSAELRMQLIAPLLAPNLDKDSLAKLRAEISQNSGVSEKTIVRYCCAYFQNGFEGLKPQGRVSPKYKIPQDLLDEAIQLRKEQPNRSISTIIQILEMEGKSRPGFLKRTTLQDAMSRAGYSSSMMKIYQDKGYASQRFQRTHRFDLWQGDIKYGPTLIINSVPTPTYFSCLIDDATRYIVHGEFYPNMEQSIVEDTLHKAVMEYGAPRRLYFDNGSQYRTHWMKRACGLMGIRLIYAKPRNPQGKGKQERFNLTIDAFLDEVMLEPPTSIEELNNKFNSWLDVCYHSVEHSALGTTPEIAFKSDSMPARFIDTAVLARAFLHCEPRKVDKSGCISFQGKRYDLSVKYAGKTVDVVYDPANTEILTIECSGELPFQVHRAIIGSHVAGKPKKAEFKPAEVDHSRLLSAAEKVHREKGVQRKRAISYTSELGKE